VKSTPTRGVKQSLKPDAHKQWEEVRIQMTEKGFESLDVYRRAYGLAMGVHRRTLGFPQIEQFGLADQMRRASKGICANIAEGFARQEVSGADWRRYLTVAIGSADEMRVWCAFARDLGYLEATTADAWRSDYSEIARMLHGLGKAWQNRQRS
jgi:four helix bundle protein